MTDSITADDTYTILPYTLDEGLMARAAIGLIVLAVDQTLEYEWREIMRIPGVVFFESRLPNSADINPVTLADMEKDIARAAALIVPNLPLSVVAFGCTSGAIVIGEQQVFDQIHRARPGIACTTPITAAMVGLKALGALRIALITPYVPSINALFKTHIEAGGISVTRIASFNNGDDAQVARIDRASLKAAILTVGRAQDVDAVFVSCTSLRMVGLTTEVEDALGKPVVSSNGAMAWHALRLAGVDDAMPRFGRLFEV